MIKLCFSSEKWAFLGVRYEWRKRGVYIWVANLSFWCECNQLGSVKAGVQFYGLDLCVR
jgi:hypothetical protein